MNRNERNDHSRDESRWREAGQQGRDRGFERDDFSGSGRYGEPQVYGESEDHGGYPSRHARDESMGRGFGGRDDRQEYPQHSQRGRSGPGSWGSQGSGYGGTQGSAWASPGTGQQGEGSDWGGSGYDRSNWGQSDFGRNEHGGVPNYYRGSGRFDESFGDRGYSERGREGWGQSQSGQNYGQGSGGDYGRAMGGQARANWPQRHDYSSTYGNSPSSNYGSGGGLSGAKRQGPKGYTRSDDRLKDDVCDRLMQHHELDISAISIEVQDGKVTLEGSVPDRWMKHHIEDVVDGCNCVKDVENRIRISRDEMGSEGRSSFSSGASSSASSPGLSASGGSPSTTSGRGKKDN